MVGILEECLRLKSNAAYKCRKRKFLGIRLLIKTVLGILIDQLQSTYEVSVNISYRKNKNRLCMINCLDINFIAEIWIIIRIVCN